MSYLDMKFGGELEFFGTAIHPDTNRRELVYARSLTRKTDGNSSVFEINTEPVKLPHELGPLMWKELEKLTEEIVSAKGMEAVKTLQYVFTPCTWTYVKFQKIPVLRFMTAGLHLHISKYPRPQESMAGIDEKFYELYKRFGVLAQMRKDFPVIGPSSGNRYQYAGPPDYWRTKSPEDEWTEFRGYPSSSLAMSTQGLHYAAEYLQYDGNFPDYILDIIVEMARTPLVVDATDFLESNNVCTLRIYDYREYDSLDCMPKDRVVVSNSPYTCKFLYLIVVEDEDVEGINKYDIEDQVGPYTYVVKRSDLPRLLSDFKEGEFLWDTKELHDSRKQHIKYMFDHPVPPIGKMWNNLTPKDKIELYPELMQYLNGMNKKEEVNF